MTENKENILNQFKKEIQMIEEWSITTCNDILYDSDYCNDQINFNDTTFNDHILNKH